VFTETIGAATFSGSIEHLLANHGMREGWISVRHAPVVRASGVALKVQQGVEGLAKTRTGPREPVRQIGEARNAAFERGCVAHMQDQSRRDGRCGILPIAFLRTVLAGMDDHVGNLLEPLKSRGVLFSRSSHA
jgi:hypothetical protein